MQTGSLRISEGGGPLVYNDKKIASIVVYELEFGKPKIHEPSLTSDYLRFFFSTRPFQITTKDSVRIVAERTPIKVHPNTEVKFDMRKGDKLYEIHLANYESPICENPEQRILQNLTTKYASFFEELPENYKKIWNNVADKDLDYILEIEPNSGHIQRDIKGVLIAPPHSRFRKYAGDGWNFIFPRGSRALGIAYDLNFKVRDIEIPHKHSILTEIYLCLDGAYQVEVDGKVVTLNNSSYLVAEPGEVHAEINYLKIPCHRVTLQMPSIPGDRYTVDGVRFK